MANNAMRIENEFEELVSGVGMPKQIKEIPDDEKDLVSGTLEACLKVLLKKKSAAEDSASMLQKELDVAKEKIKKLEQAVHRRGIKGKQLVKKLTETEKEKSSLLTELKSCHQQIKEELEKRQKLQNLYTESLKTKNSQIQILEKENSALRQARKFLGEDSSDISLGQTFNESFPPPLNKKDVHASGVYVNVEEEEMEDSQDNIDWDPYFGGVKVSQDDAEGMIENYDMLQHSYTEALKAKNERIKQLEEDFEAIKSHRLLSMSQFGSVSSDLSLDSIPSDVLSSSAGSYVFSSSKAQPDRHQHARLSLPGPHNPSHRKSARSFSSSDWDPNLKAFQDQCTARPRIGSLKMQMDSFESLSPCDSPIQSGSTTPTSTVSSYAGVLGNSTSLENSFLKRKRKEGGYKNGTFLQSPKPLTRKRSPQKKELESAKIDGFPPKESKGEPQLSKRNYMSKRQKDKKPEDSSSKASKNESKEVPFFSLESGSTICINIEEAGSSKSSKIDQAACNDHSAEVTERQSRRRSTSLSEKRFSPFLSEESKSSSENASIPQWKKDLIQKKKLAGSNGHCDKKIEEPEWKAKAPNRRKVSEISVH